jgi:hypothetical protein
MASDHLWPCGCLRNTGGAHRAHCPDFATVVPAGATARLENLSWIRRPDPFDGCLCGPMPSADGYVYGCPVHDPNPPRRAW